MWRRSHWSSESAYAQAVQHRLRTIYLFRVFAAAPQGPQQGLLRVREPIVEHTRDEALKTLHAPAAGLSIQTGGWHFRQLIGHGVQFGPAQVSNQRFCNPENSICAAAYLWPMRHTDSCHFEAFETGVYTLLVLNIQMGGALIEKEDFWLPI